MAHFNGTELGASVDAGAEFGVAVGEGSFYETWGEFTTALVSSPWSPDELKIKDVLCICRQS